MFEVSWSELLILGLVTLIFVGPKDLPRFMATLGRYAAVVRRHANEFRAVFEQAMREAEMDQIQKEIRDVKDGVKASLDEAVRSVDSVREAARISDAEKEPGKAAVAATGAAGADAPAMLPLPLPVSEPPPETGDGPPKAPSVSKEGPG
jgi:sec-independent protein translocase protein TatB